MMLAHSSWDQKACIDKQGGGGPQMALIPLVLNASWFISAGLQPPDLCADIIQKDGFRPEGSEALSSYHITMS
jgi:hypothetical protein